MSRIFAEGQGTVKDISETVTTNGNATLTNVNVVANPVYVGMSVSGDGIPENTYVTATNLGSTQVTISNAATTTGQDITATFNKTNYNTATNPRFRTFGAYSGSERLYTIVYEQPPNGSAETFVQQLATGDSADTEYSNLETTEGHKIISYDFNTQIGMELSLDANNNYFVLVHSDDYKKHHFAKITTTITENNTNFDGSIENTVIGFEFEPKLGSEIERDSKFMVFKGPPIADTARECKILAISAGIKKDLQDNLVCSRPLFYFFNDNLDKKNQLDHNTKYFMKFKGANATTITAGDATGLLNTFVTETDNRGVIKDYSKYTHNLKVVDNLKKFDYPAYKTQSGGNKLPFSLPNEWNGTNTFPLNVSTFAFTDYNDCFPNARRDTDLDISSDAAMSDGSGHSAQVFTGPTRYIHYDFSPTRANKLYNLFEVDMSDSADNRGSYFEGRAVDNKRILGSKLKHSDMLRVRHRLHKGNFNEWFELKAKIKIATGTTNEYTFTTEYDLSTLFNVGDEVKINNRILIVQTIDSINNSGTTGKEQDITFRTVHRVETEGIFSDSSTYTLAAGSSIYRRAWNSTDKTLLTTFDIIENRNNNLYVKLISNEFGFLEATVTNSDHKKQLLTLDFAGTSHISTDSALDYMFGSYYIEIEKFKGEIERLRKTKENGQTIFDIAGRSEIKKLLGPIVNKNTLHSKDIIYSSNTFYEKMEYVGGGSVGMRTDCNFDSKVVTYVSTHNLAVGDHIYLLHNEHGTISYIGEVAALGEDDGSGGFQNTTTKVTLKEKSLAQSSTAPSSDDDGLVARTNYYVFNKALSSNRAITSTSTLSGTSTKGLFFTGGNVISADGSEGINLVGSSASSNPLARGYYLSDSLSVLTDGKFQARLDDNASGTTTATDKTYQNFNTVNTLLDFTVLDSTLDKDRTVVTLAPYMPLTLGRVDINYANTKDTTFSATTLGTVTSVSSGKAISVGTSSYNAISSTDLLKYHGEPLYANGVFIGRMVIADPQADFSLIISVDNKSVPDITGQTIQIISPTGVYGETTKLTHELNMLNGGHLHGGKTIGLIHPNYRVGASTGSNKVMLQNHYLRYVNASGNVNQTGDDIQTHTSIEKFGAPLYRIYNVEKGNYNRVGNPSTPAVSSTPFVMSRYYTETLSKIPFYASAYKINFGYSLLAQGGPTVSNNYITGVGKTDKNVNNHILPESRGLTNVAGSRFFDTITHKKGGSRTNVVYANSASGNGEDGNPFISKDILNQIDPKVSRMFLFANSDRQPYSSTRHDSLLFGSQTRDISDYGFVGLRKSKITANSDIKETNVVGVTTSVNYTDDDYVTAGIVSSDKTLSSLKRFSLMRLTEIVFDWAFNQIDPENGPSTERLLPLFTYASYDWTLLTGGSGYWQSSTNNQVQVADYSGATLTADADVSSVLADNDLVVDANGRLIGQVASIGGAGNTVITFNNNIRKTNGSSYFVGDLYKVTALQNNAGVPTSNCTIVYGHDEEETFVNWSNRIHMLKSMVTNDSQTYGDGGSTAWNTLYSHDLDCGSSTNRLGNIYLPISLQLKMENKTQGGSSEDADILGASTFADNHPSQIFEILDNLDGNTLTLQVSNHNALYNGMLPLFLDRFSIEDGAQRASKGMVGQSIDAISRAKVDGGTSIDKGIFPIATFMEFNKFDDSQGNARTYDKDSDGVMLTFKPRLYIDESASTNDGPSGTSTSHYIINPITAKDGKHFDDSDGDDLVDDSVEINRRSLSLMNDLTGCYLVSEAGKYFNELGSETTYNLNTYTPISLDKMSPTTIAYVISHEIETTNTNLRHNIITDKPLPTGYYRIMQPNHTCLYDFSPQEIAINTLSSAYTKVSGENRCYDAIQSYLVGDKKSKKQIGNFYDTGGNEAALSMYVVADLDGQSSSSEIVLRDGNNFESILDSKSYDMCISDGNNPYRTSLEYIDTGNNIGHTLKFSEIKEQLGIVSISEVFSITLSEEIDGILDRALIGSTVTICNEAEELVNELLEDEGIVFSNTDPEYPLFLAPNFQGIDLFSAINFLLNKKDKTIFHDNDTFQIKSREDTFFDTGVFVSDNSDAELYNYDKDDNFFNLYNEVSVYGKIHKAVRSDFTSIKQYGKKSLEIYDSKLTTQIEVNKRADEELEIHTTLNESIEIDVGHKKLSQIRAGDIIELEIPRENIKRNVYKILQIKHLLTGNMKIQLGRYNKLLEDRFSELAIESKELRTEGRSARFDESNKGYIMSEKIKIKPIKLIVRERKSNGGLVFGFGATLNTNSRPLGFGQSLGVTHTTLLEEEY